MNKIEYRGNKSPLFVRFLNREITAGEIIRIFQKEGCPDTVLIPDLADFYTELEEAVRDIIGKGMGEEFQAFVNHYMSPVLVEDVQISDTPKGENISCAVKVVDWNGPWIQGVICYNLCLYIKVFGLDELKVCKVCGKIFSHKGKYAIYCSNACKADKNKSVRETSGNL